MMMMFITNRRETKARKGEERERWLGKSDRNYSNFGATRTSRKNKQTNRGERATSDGGLGQDPKSGDVAHLRGRPARDRGRALPKT